MATKAQPDIVGQVASIASLFGVAVAVSDSTTVEVLHVPIFKFPTHPPVAGLRPRLSLRRTVVERAAVPVGRSPC